MKNKSSIKTDVWNCLGISKSGEKGRELTIIHSGKGIYTRGPDENTRLQLQSDISETRVQDCLDSTALDVLSLEGE